MWAMPPSLVQQRCRLTIQQLIDRLSIVSVSPRGGGVHIVLLLDLVYFWSAANTRRETLKDYRRICFNYWETMCPFIEPF